MDRDDDEGLFRLIVSSILEIHRTEPRFERLMLHASLEGHELAVMHRNQIMASIGVRFQEYIERRQHAGAMRDAIRGPSFSPSSAWRSFSACRNTCTSCRTAAIG